MKSAIFAVSLSLALAPLRRAVVGRGERLSQGRAGRRRGRPLRRTSWRPRRDRRLRRRPSPGQRKEQGKAGRVRGGAASREPAERLLRSGQALLFSARRDLGSSGQRGRGGDVERVGQAEPEPFDASPCDHRAVVRAQVLRRRDHRQPRFGAESLERLPQRGVGRHAARDHHRLGRPRRGARGRA